MFDGSYPYTATEKGLALTFPFPGSHDLTTLSHDLGEQAQAFEYELDLTNER